MRAISFSLPFLFLLGCASSVARSEGSVSELFRKVSPAVVTVKTQGRQVDPRANVDSRSRFTSVAGLGSGVLVRVGGKVFVMTASHVVQTADQLYVEFADGRKIPGRVKASAPSADVALLELDAEPPRVTPLEIGDSDSTSVGDRVFIVGAPYGLSSSLSVGYVSARRRSKAMLGSFNAMELFQTDAAINTGNSGGPMFNIKGEVVGIVSHILSRSGGFEGTGFAVTSNLARKLLIDEPTLWSGLESYVLSGELAKVFNVPQSAGVLVQRVAEKSPASKLGIEAGTLAAQIGSETLIVGGDILLTVAGIAIEADLAVHEKIRKRLRSMPDTELLRVNVLRAGKVVELRWPIGDLRR